MLLIQQDKAKEGGEMDFPLAVAMATTADGGRLISCTAVELREGERERKRERERLSVFPVNDSMIM